MSKSKTLSTNSLDAGNKSQEQVKAEHLDQILGEFDTSGIIRDGIEQEKQLGFEHIVERPEYKERFDFRIENDDKGQIQRLQSRGWRVATGSVFPEVSMGSSFELSEGSRDKSESMACVSVGIRADNTPMKAYLMFAPKGTNDKLQDLMHKENADRKKMIGHLAKEKAVQESFQGTGGNPSVYTPEGTEDGFSGMSRGPINQITSS